MVKVEWEPLIDYNNNVLTVDVEDNWVATSFILFMD